MSSAGEAAPSKNKGEKTIWQVSATIANKKAVRMRGPAVIVMVSGFIPPAPLSNIIAHAQASRMPKRVGGQAAWGNLPKPDHTGTSQDHFRIVRHPSRIDAKR